MFGKLSLKLCPLFFRALMVIASMPAGREILIFTSCTFSRIKRIPSWNLLQQLIMKRQKVLARRRSRHKKFITFLLLLFAARAISCIFMNMKATRQSRQLIQQLNTVSLATERGGKQKFRLNCLRISQHPRPSSIDLNGLFAEATGPTRITAKC